MYIEVVSNKEFIAIKNHAFRISSINYFKLSPKRLIIKVVLKNNKSFKLKFHKYDEYVVCLDTVFDSIKVIDYHHPRVYFKR